MKRFLFALLAIAAVSIGASAQKTTLSVSYGAYTQMDACDNHDGWHNVNTAWGALNAAVNFRVSPNLWVGPSYTFSSTTVQRPGMGKIAYHAIMLNCRGNYYHNSLLTVYARLGLGAVISHMQPGGGDPYNRGYFAMQISPVGVDIPLDRTFTMFGEAGFGAQGLLQVGFRANL